MRQLLFVYVLMSLGIFTYAVVGQWLQSGTEELREGRYELYSRQDGEVWWRLKSPTGQVIASGEGYRDLMSARASIDAVRRFAAEAKIEELEAR